MGGNDRHDQLRPEVSAPTSTHGTPDIAPDPPKRLETTDVHPANVLVERWIVRVILMTIRFNRHSQGNDAYHHTFLANAGFCIQICIS